MSQIQALPTPLSTDSRPLVFTKSEAKLIPRTLWFVVIGAISFMVGAHWDLSWHRSIGRDVALTPPHMLIDLSALLVGIGSLYAILWTTFAGSSQGRAGSIRILGLRGPAGAFMAAWGSVAMLASQPFDAWWHTAFGMFVKIFTLPHMLLSSGYFIVIAGATAWIASLRNGPDQAFRGRLVLLFLIVGTLDVVQLWVGLTEPANRQNMHTAAFYVAVAAYIPYALIGLAWGSTHKWGCTILAAIYTGIEVGWVWLLPLIPAQPRLGPVYQNITHFIPFQFPVLLIVPAFVADLLLQRLEHRSSWIKAIWIGPAFILSFLAVQWPFANFLMSPASRNWIFGTTYFPYADPAGTLYDPYQFIATERPVDFVIAMLVAFVIAILSIRLGLGWGGWMRRVRR